MSNETLFDNHELQLLPQATIKLWPDMTPLATGLWRTCIDVADDQLAHAFSNLRSDNSLEFHDVKPDPPTSDDDLEDEDAADEFDDDDEEDELDFDGEDDDDLHDDDDDD